MNYPLSMSFKVWAIAQQIRVTDASGNLIFFVKQKAFKLKEDVTLYADEALTKPFYRIRADRVIDFNAKYNFLDAQENPVGQIKRHGMRSIWKTHYDVYDGETVVLSIREENAWVKVLDSLVGEVPVLGFFTGYLFNPAYLVTRPDGTLIMRLNKEPAFFEGKFTIEAKAEFMPGEEARALLGLVMMTLLERRKG